MEGSGNGREKLGPEMDKYIQYAEGSQEEMEKEIEKRRDKIEGIQDMICGMLRKIGGRKLERRFRTALHIFFNRDRFCVDKCGIYGWIIALIVLVLFYLVLPADAIPDWIPVVGYGDDAGFIALALGKIGDVLDCYADCVGI